MASDPQQETSPEIIENEDDTMISEALRQEDEFLEYLMSFPRLESSSVPTRPISTINTVESTSSGNNNNNSNEDQPKVGLDHLDNLCKLMEQLGELREQNNRLQKRVQYLEDLRALQDMHRQLKSRIQNQRQSSEESLHNINNSATSGIQSDDKQEENENKTLSLHQSQSFRRARSRSVGPDEIPIPPKAKVSKWTRVKEAFRWEKAQLVPIISAPVVIQQLPEAKSQDSGIGLGQDGVRTALLQVPMRNTESISPADSVLSYSAPMSSSSSSEDLMDIDLDFAALSEATDFNSGPQRSASAAADTNDRHIVELRGRRRSLSPGPDDEASRRSKSLETGGEDNSKLILDKKASKTPWGKVKNIIQTRRDSLKRRGPPRLGGSDDEADDESGPRSHQRSREPSGDKRPPTLTITLPSTEELHPPKQQVKPPQSPHTEDRVLRPPRLSDLQGARPKEVYRRQSSLHRPCIATQAQSGTSPPIHRRPSKWTKVKKAFLTSRREDETGLAISMPCSPGPSATQFQFDRSVSSPTHAEIQRNYEELQSRLSQEFSKKLGEWERRKSNVGPPRDITAITSGDEEQLSADFRKKLHEWEKIKSGVKDDEVQPPPPPPPPPMPPPPPVHYHLSPQFRKRLLEWQIRRAISGKAGPHEEHELHRVLPEDFTRKLQQWERIKAGKTSPRLTRKDSRGETKENAGGSHEKSKIAHKEKQLQWLEKELNKVEREKRRLERDREKFLEREARLERMRRAMRSPDSSGEQEVLIQTSTGFFRFQGISEQFTKRLYEWEQQRGIAPEASTFALLDPKFRPEAGEEAVDNTGLTLTTGTLVRSKSVGSVADMTGTPATTAGDLVQSQPSSLSLNDVEALEAELEEPRLRSDSHSRPRTDSRSVPRSRSNSRSAPRVRPVTLATAPVLLVPKLDESPSAVIVDVEDEIEEALQEIPAVHVETAIWSFAPDEVTSLSQQVTTSEQREVGEDRGVKRGDSVRSYQLLEENMQLLGELKEKEAICRQLEAEMEQLERKLQDVAATQNRQLERLRREETDRTHGEEQQSSTPILSSNEERVQRLRRSVMELGARRQRLQRQGQALQDSFAHAWQEQAALAQSLVGRMRLLRRGVTEDEQCAGEDQVSPHVASSVVASELGAGIPCQDPVARIQDLSQQLLTLAEKLEQALSSRTREIQNLRSELLRGSSSGNAVCRERLRPPSRAESHLSASLSSLQTREVVESLLPRQSSDEMAELPLLLTNKVLELKEGLSDLCAAACKERDQTLAETRITPEIDIYPAEEEVTADEAESPSATFVIRVGGRSRGPSEVISSTPLYVEEEPTPEEEPEAEISPPVTSLTICPAFWKRVPVTEGEGHRSPDNSFCSALSSSESEREEEEEKSYYESDTNEPIVEQKLIIRSHTTGSILKQQKDEPTFVEIQREKSEDDANKNQRKCSIKRSKNLCEENRDLWRQHQYVTTVSTTAISAEAKKLKTRRVSDTHVAYKSQEQSGSEPSSPINVFVPTQRKIFSPIQGKTENIIGYVVSDSSGNIPEKTNELQAIAPWRRRGSTESENSRIVDNSCVVPWRRTRDSQSASPALPRKILAGNFSPESSPRTRRLLLERKNEHSPLPPPFPRSPTPNRRGAELKNNKEAAPSIKLMIAKYNQKISEQPSPEIRTTSSSPAWRSPVAERRDRGMVRAQMEKYQEEVSRALKDGFSSSRFGNSVQKSASAGALRFPSKPPQKPPPLLKSSSAGAIKSPLLPIKKIEIPPLYKTYVQNEKLDDTPSSPLDESIDLTIQTYRKNPASPRQISSKTPHSPCLRALKIKRAKEEFLSRGPGSISTDGGCRLSQVSAGSGSSFEDLLINNEGIKKSASAGMINIHPSVYKRLTEPQKDEPQISKSTYDIKPDPTSSSSTSLSKSKFGFSGLASKLRKVRLRKKDRLNTVSYLCRQSLLVDLNDSRHNESNQASTSTLGPSTSGSPPGGKESISCPSSPVLLHKSTWTKKKPK